MNEATTIVKALYENFLLRDIFAKIIPGVILISVSVYQIPLTDEIINVAEKIGWPMVFIGAGTAWIMGFAIQELGEIFHIIKHHPESYSDAKQRYKQRIKFESVASANHSQQVERYAVIKEATGNGATTVFLSLFVVYLHKIISGIPLFSWASMIQELMVIVFALALVRANRSHAKKQYEYIDNVVDMNDGFAIVLDFDGVIADSMPGQAKAWEKAILSIGKGNQISEQQKAILLQNFWSGYSGTRIFEGTRIPTQIQSELREIKDGIWHRTRRSVAPIPGVVDAIHKLEKLVPLSISTTAPRMYVESTLERFKIHSCFTHIVTDGDVSNPKPAPDALNLIAHSLSITTKQLVMIGDTKTDRQMAITAGSQFVLLNTQSVPPEERNSAKSYSDWPTLVHDLLPKIQHRENF